MSALGLIHDAIATSVEPLGMRALGWLVVDRGDDPDAGTGKAGVLIGNVGGEMWPAFSSSSEYVDGMPDPMNRWTQGVVNAVADKVGASQTRFPFGDKVWPFQRYARLATGNQASPLGLLIDPEFGLWWALRAVILFEDEKLIQGVHVLNQLRGSRPHPCVSCVEKPCLSACPVDAFSGSDGKREGLVQMDVAACRSHLHSGEDPRCMELGCRARAACPVGREHEYPARQRAFHMSAFS